MNSPTDDDPELDLEQIFVRERSALAEARAKVAFIEHELARLAKDHPEVAALRVPDFEFMAADLRTDELNTGLARINAALELTGDEQDYWLKLWALARAHLGIDEDEFDEMTREKLAAIIEAGLPNIQAAVRPAESATGPPAADSGTGDNSALPVSPLPKQPRNTWARSRSPRTENLHTRIREMKAQGLSQLEMCEGLDAHKLRLPDLVSWRHLTWRAAYRSPEYGGTVKKWLSKVTAVTP